MNIGVLGMSYPWAEVKLQSVDWPSMDIEIEDVPSPLIRPPNQLRGDSYPATDSRQPALPGLNSSISCAATRPGPCIDDAQGAFVAQASVCPSGHSVRRSHGPA